LQLLAGLGNKYIMTPKATNGILGMVEAFKKQNNAF